MKLFILNAGSSTYKCSIYDLENQNKIDSNPIWQGILDYGIGSEGMSLKASSRQGQSVEMKWSDINLDEGVKKLIQTSWLGPTQVMDGPGKIGLVGHRIVHGGDKFYVPTLITEEVKQVIRELIPLAPLHNPVNLEGIEIVQTLFPDIPHFGVFDTAFHYYMPEHAKTYAIPYKYRSMGIRRYGFHGISHEYSSKQAARLLNKDVSSLKIVSCHLGNGSSLAAIKHGRSIDTTMGFTPLEGIIMGTRCGSIDAGILLYLVREGLLNFDELDHCLNYESGLLGICGFSDMREILHRRQNSDPKAILAFDMLVHSLARNIGAMMGVLGGIDVLTFTGGIGENVPELRERIGEHLKFAGMHIDKDKNDKHCLDKEISSSSSLHNVLVIEAKEDLAIAQACLQVYNP